MDAAQATLSSASPILARAARSGGHWLAVAEAQVRGPIQIAVAGDPASDRCWPPRAGWRRAGRWWSAVHSTRRNC